MSNRKPEKKPQEYITGFGGIPVPINRQPGYPPYIIAFPGIVIAVNSKADYERVSNRLEKQMIWGYLLPMGVVTFTYLGWFIGILLGWWV